MIRHYLRMSLRVLRKQRLYAAINIVGLSIALGLVTLIFLFVHDELTFDHWNVNLDRIYRVDRVDFLPDGSVEGKGPWLPYPFAEAVKRDHPAVENTVRMHEADVVLRVEGVALEAPVLFVDSTFATVFTIHVIRGSDRTALVDPESIVFTKSAAMRHFNTIDIVGRDVEVRFEDSYEGATVTAVVNDPPANTSIPYEILMPFHRTPMVYPWIAGRTDRWNASSFHVFTLLKENTNVAAAQATLASLWKKYYPDRAERSRLNGSWTGEGDPASYEFIALKDLHLDTSTSGGLVANSNPLYSAILGAIGLTILGLACINFVILTIGRGATRAAEIGVRKAMGAQRSQLMTQFGSESILLSVLALVIGVAFSTLLMPTFNSLSGKSLTLEIVRDFPLLLSLIGIALLTGVIAGWYPSLVISRHRPAETLRGRFKIGGTSLLTKSLVVAQFSASIILVAGALVMNQQMEYIQKTDLGFDDENVLVVHTNGKDGRALARHLERTIGQRPDVAGVAALSFSLNRGYDVQAWGADGEERFAYVYNIEPDILDILDIDVIAGRAFDERFVSDSTFGTIINEAFAAQIGFTPEEAIGQRIIGRGESPPFIVGVIPNINFRSLHEQVEPMIMTMDDDNGMYYNLVKVRGADLSGIIADLGEAWASFAPDIPLEYTFLDEDVARTYENDQRWSRVVSYAAAVAILIACMGLFGLAALTIARRTKEIGVRKVLGASVSNILILVSRDFVKLVLVASVFAAPVAYLSLRRWLDGFVYRVDPSIWVFALAGLTVLVVALLTVAYHAVRAATGNPVEALRYE